MPDVPYCGATVCVLDGVLLAIGGSEGQIGSRKVNGIHAFHAIDRKWRHIGDLPFECSNVETLPLSGGSLLVVDGDSKGVLKVTAEGRYYCVLVNCTHVVLHLQVWRDCFPMKGNVYIYWSS